MTVPSPSPVFVLVGGAGGIGQALCRRLLEKGAVVVVASRSAERLEAARAIGAITHVLDARDFDATAALFRAVSEQHGRLDGAVNLAGSIVLKAAHATSAADFDDVIGLNLKTAFAVVRSAAPLMTRAGGGSIVLMSSAAARIGLANHDAIGAAKAAIEGLTRSSAATYAGRGVRVNAVAPGLVRTPLAERIVSNPKALEASEAMHALGRIGEPDEVASLIAWLLGEATWVTGQVFGIDGGLSSVRAR